MKNLVLESSNNSAKSGGDPLDAAPTEETEKLVRQIKDMKSLLLQRDSEIQILVNMVQKGKTAEDVTGAQMRSSRGTNRSDDMSESGHSQSRDRTARAPAEGAQQQQAPGRGGRTFQEQQQLAQMQRERENQERIIKRHLFGVPPPSDRAIFDDCAGIFSYFPFARCPQEN